ncbi:MAG: hypothetical protein QM638_06455 [Nocardioides sp.]|uniref:hypothetical protein n=1 Tax=Nocardioides sp. TaxID=35761 RepID=UPI0039E5EC0B
MTTAATPVPSLAVLFDNARTAIAAAREADLEVSTIGVSPEDFDLIERSKRFEERIGLPLRILGVVVEPDADVALGSVRL